MTPRVRLWALAVFMLATVAWMADAARLIFWVKHPTGGDIAGQSTLVVLMLLTRPPRR